MVLPQSPQRHAVLNPRPGARLTMGRHAAPLAQRQRDVALELAVASDRALDKLLLAFEPRCQVPSAGATRFAVLGPHPRRRTFVVVGCSFCCRLEAVQLHMISPDDKRLGARPARPQQGWIALMTKKLGDLRPVALRREILACKFGVSPGPLFSTCP